MHPSSAALLLVRRLPLLVLLLSWQALLMAAGPNDTNALTDAQRRLKDASDQLDRAQADAGRAQRALKQAQDGLEQAQREVERRRTQVDEATKAKARADEQLAQVQGQYKAAREVIEKFYDAQQQR